MNDDAGRPIKVNKKQLKEIEMDERFKRLEEKGEVDKFMKGKRKKLQQRNKVRKFSSIVLFLFMNFLFYRK